jgi:RNA polymerase sigma factor (sigma-70 family)
MNDADLALPIDWVENLRAGASKQAQCIATLQLYLVRGLTRALKHRYGGTVPIEDVVQEALIKILESLDSFQGRSRFETWAMSIAIRIGISKLRRHYYRDVSLEHSMDEQGFQIAVEDHAADNSERAEDRLKLIGLLQVLIQESLSERQRVAIQGTLQGLPIEEIAIRLKSNRNAVYKLVHDARLRLKQGFEAQGFTSQDIVSAVS